MIEILAIAIPLISFDQEKLHALVSKIPAALVNTEKLERSEKRYYSFPKYDDKGFKINCEAEYFLESKVPSYSSCELFMLKDAIAGMDEHKTEFKDPFVVKNFFGAISYGSQELKKWNTGERVYGMSLRGKYEDHFRYTITCSKEKCEMTYSTKAR